MNQRTVLEIAAIVGNEYEVEGKELLAARSEHVEARKLLIELCYRCCLETRTLKQLGEELGGISGSGIARVHERLKKTIEEDQSLSEKLERLIKRVCQ